MNNYYKISQWPQALALVFPFDDPSAVSRKAAFAACVAAMRGMQSARIAVYRSFFGNTHALVGDA